MICDRCGGKMGADGCPSCGLGAGAGERSGVPSGEGVSNTPPQGATSGGSTARDGRAPLQPPRLLARRLDALEVAFRVALSVEAAGRLEQSRAVADVFRKAELRIGSVDYQLKPTRSRERHYFSNADIRCLWDSKATGGRGGDEPEPGWTLVLTCRATYLATHTLAEALELLDDTASDFGEVFDRRVRRVDLACDFADWAIRRADLDVFVRRGRSMITQYLPDGDVPDAPAPGEDSRVYYDRKRRLTGYTVGMGGPIVTRIYDKVRELDYSQNADKKALEEGIWRAAGWRDGDDVTRVEFQLRGDALKEICAYFDSDKRFVSPLRDPARLQDNLDQAFHYLVGTPDGKHGWLRMVLPETATRAKRAALDPRWTVLRQVVFFHAGREQARRLRFRDGATLPMAIGCVVSLLTDEQQIERLEVMHPSEGYELLPGELQRVLTEEERKRWIEARVLELSTKFADVMRVGLEADPEGADKLLATWNANVARFASRKP